MIEAMSDIHQSSLGAFSRMKIGYLIPEFPGQTHAFFWREQQALKELGIETSLISTSCPPQEVISHDWSKQAQRETVYLVPPTFQDAMNVASILLQAGPKAWLQCARAVMQADDMSLSQKLRLVALIPVAAKLVWLSKVQGWTHIHVHSCASSADIALFASLLSNISYSLTQHGPAFDTYGPNQAQKWNHASFGILVSDVLLQHARERIGHSLPDQLSVVPMGVNLDDFSRACAYTPWQPGQPCQIFTIGRLNPVKAHDDLIDAVAKLAKKGFDVHLKIAGEDEQGGKGYRMQLEKVIQDKGMADRVQLLGAVSEPVIRRHLEESHLFALASLNEGTSVAIMESMAMELPAVTTAVGGTPKLITQGVNGILVEPRDSDALADAIEQVLADPQLAVSLGQAARQTIVEKYHHRRSAQVLADFLQDNPQPERMLVQSK
jgi:colanic acid/amylovoran biosynthesis glycosyltransferase